MDMNEYNGVRGPEVSALTNSKARLRGLSTPPGNFWPGCRAICQDGGTLSRDEEMDVPPAWG